MTKTATIADDGASPIVSAETPGAEGLGHRHHRGPGAVGDRDMTVGPLRCTSERSTEMAGPDSVVLGWGAEQGEAVINRDVQLASDGRADLVALHVDERDGLARRKLGHLAE